MQQCLGGQLTDSTLVYLDDVICFFTDFYIHLDHLEEVFKAMERYGLKFLRHCIGGKGVAPDPDKVSLVQEWQSPMTVKQVRSFLGFVGY